MQRFEYALKQSGRRQTTKSYEKWNFTENLLLKISGQKMVYDISDHLPVMLLQFIDTPSLAKSYFPCYLLDGAIISTGVSLKVVQNPLPYR